MAAEPLLELRNLTTVFPTRRGEVTAVNAVNLRVAPGEILGIVGESGCGKSTILLSILGLVPRPGRIEQGEIFFQGKDLTNLRGRAMRSLRGRAISMIFQDPQSTLNPVFPVGEQIREAMRLHGLLDGGRRPRWLGGRRKEGEKRRVLEVMEEVGIPAPEARYRNYPHEFSGGMQQRALIAIGLVCEPALILADEPTTALDVTIQAQIIEVMRRINRDHGTSIILVTHNLALASEFCHSIAVMYAGRIVERGPVEQVVGDPQHPYTQGLLRCLPRISQRAQRIDPIPGEVPDLASLPPGCAFAPRCPVVEDGCWQAELRLRAVTPGHYARCIKYEAGERYTEEEVG
ncbi:MAG: ABC transporter ATP-binding protein [Anaerolineae bacterium]|nr:ABC transporter ATP-binding protein [Anaerolineae bacterium]